MSHADLFVRCFARRPIRRVLLVVTASVLSSVPGSADRVSFPTGAAATTFLSVLAGRAGYRVTQGYGANARQHDATKGATTDVYGYGPRGHDGWDVALGRPGRDGRTGAAVHAPVSGRVERGEQRDAAGRLVGLGRWVTLFTRGGTSVTFGHLAGFGTFGRHEVVAAGTVLGFEGTSGHSTGYHVHILVRDARGRTVDPGAESGMLMFARPTRPVPMNAVSVQAVQAAESAFRQAQADHETARELFAVGAVARIEVERRAARVLQARREWTAVRSGDPGTPSAFVVRAAARRSLERADAAYRAARSLYEVGGLSRQELHFRERQLASARAAYRALGGALDRP